MKQTGAAELKRQIMIFICRLLRFQRFLSPIQLRFRFVSDKSE
ncbi:hypothetical protein B4140_3507 [Bacillus amyloliquefaciens]|nr:hypothetical protein B4140_3507 [Bacillus amyloliquefaciens]RAP13054.1 hypothetical protein HS9_02042 [Bacillus velezensis]